MRVSAEAKASALRRIENLACLDAQVQATFGGVEFLLFERHRLQEGNADRDDE